MSKKDFSIIVINNNTEDLINYLNNINEQDISKDKVEIIVETAKLSKDIIEQINSIDLNIIIDEQKKLDTVSLYNNGLKKSTGKIINFTNTSFRFKSKSTLTNILEKSNNKIIITNLNVIDPLTNKEKKYLLSNTEDTLVNLKETPELFNLSLESYYINSKLLSDISFDKRFGIDASEKIIVDLLSKTNKFYNLGSEVLTTTEVLEDHRSYSKQYQNEWYEESLSKWISYLKKEKEVPLYIQEIIVYLIYIRFKYNMNSESKHDGEEIFDLIKEILKYIDSDIIVNKVKGSVYEIPRPVRQYLYKLTGKKEVPIDLNKERINIYAINYINKKLVFDCSVDLSDFIDEEDYTINIKYNNELINIKRTYFYTDTKSFNKVINTKHTFQFEIDVTNISKLYASFTYDDKEHKLEFNFVRPQSRLDNIKNAFWNYKDITLINNIKNIRVAKRNGIKTIGRELKYFINKLKIENNKKRILKLEIVRLLYYITKPFLKNKHIWITYDKLYKAGDNGEYLYQYGLEHNKNIYYIIKKDSKDYERLVSNPKNKILIFNSLKAKLYSLHSEVILKTHAGILGYCGFDGVARTMVRGLLNAEIVEAQHGLTIQDIPEYQNRLADNIKLYLIASKNEEANIMQPVYDYKKEQIKYTGISRYDGLKNDDQRIILITPTWRHNLASPSLRHGTQRAYNNSFKNSDYYKIYNNLINDEKLIEAANKYNYRIIYLIHPTLATQIDDFDKNEFVDIVAAGGDMSYEKLLRESSLMVTDYSGVQYDFAYMRKPIVYFHPKELPPHYNNGSIDYKKEGFGPIVEGSNELIKELIESMKNNCKNNDMYVKRADKFFLFDDFNSSKRMIEAVEEYLKENK